MIYELWCVRDGLTAEQIEQQINSQHPTGISSRWEIIPVEALSDANKPLVARCVEHADRRHLVVGC